MEQIVKTANVDDPNTVPNFPLPMESIVGFVCPDGQILGEVRGRTVNLGKVDFHPPVEGRFSVVLPPEEWHRLEELRPLLEAKLAAEKEKSLREAAERWLAPKVVGGDEQYEQDCHGHAVVVSVAGAYIAGSVGAVLVFLREDRPTLVVGPLKRRERGFTYEVGLADVDHYVGRDGQLGVIDRGPPGTLGLSLMER